MDQSRRVKKTFFRDNDLDEAYGFESDCSESDPGTHDQDFFDLCRKTPSSEDSKDNSKKNSREFSYPSYARGKKYQVEGSIISESSTRGVVKAPSRKVSTKGQVRSTTVQGASGHRKGDISRTLWGVVSKLKWMNLAKKVTSSSNDFKQKSGKQNVRKNSSKKLFDNQEDGPLTQHYRSPLESRKLSRSRRQGFDDRAQENRKLSREGDSPRRGAHSSGSQMAYAKQERRGRQCTDSLLPPIRHIEENLSPRSWRDCDKTKPDRKKRLPLTFGNKAVEEPKANYPDYHSQMFSHYDPSESMSNASFEYLCNYSQRKYDNQENLRTRRSKEDYVLTRHDHDILPTVCIEETASIDNPASPPVDDHSFLSLPSSEPLSECSSSAGNYFLPRISSGSDRLSSGSGTDRYDSAVGLSPDIRRKGGKLNTCDRGVSPINFGVLADHDRTLPVRFGGSDFVLNEDKLSPEIRSSSYPSDRYRTQEKQHESQPISTESVYSPRKKGSAQRVIRKSNEERKKKISYQRKDNSKDNVR